MIVNAFPFNGEMDMLRFRMAVLDPVVDLFVAVEADKTYQGQTREWVLNGDKTPKLRPHWLELRATGIWQREFEHRDRVLEACFDLGDADYIISNDADEIPSRESVSFFLERTDHGATTCGLDTFHMRLNYKTWEDGRCIFSTMQFARQTGNQRLRQIREGFPKMSVRPSGWHLSYFGSYDEIQHKLRSWSHSEFNQPHLVDRGHLEHCVRDGKYILDPKVVLHSVGPDHFPEYFLDAAPKSWWVS